MKKNKLTILLVLILFLIVANCGTDDDDPADSNYSFANAVVKTYSGGTNFGPAIKDDELTDFVVATITDLPNTNVTWSFGSNTNTVTITGNTLKISNSELDKTVTNGSILILSNNNDSDDNNKIITYRASEIRAWQDLQAMRVDKAGDYTVEKEITFPEPGVDDFPIDGFVPVGTSNNGFTGSLDGKSNIITGLFISNSSLDNVGLIGSMGNNGVVTNVGLVDVDITGSNAVGGLVGSSYGTVTGYATGSVTGNDNVGGLVGFNDGTVTGYASGSVNGNVNGSSYNVGGLVGNNDGTVTGYATGSVTGVDYSVGGLVGWNSGTVTGYATGSVTGVSPVGGLVGNNFGGTVTGYATGSVTGSGAYVGGLVGHNNAGTVTGYATGSVTGSGNVGGLVGANAGTVTGYWDQATTGQINSGGGLAISAIINVIYDGTNYTDTVNSNNVVFTNETFLSNFSLPGESARWPKMNIAIFPYLQPNLPE